MTMNRPLKKGDTLALVCTGSVVGEKAAQGAKAYLEGLGFAACYAEDAYTSLAPCARADIFLQYLHDKSVTAIWSLRGGEGSADILPFLQAHHDVLRKLPPKWLIGFSDFTPFLNYFQHEFAWQTVHGPNVLQMVDNKVNEASQSQLWALIGHDEPQLPRLHLLPLSEQAKQPQIIQAPLCGGNLSLLHISLKDIWEISCEGKILFIEEVNEKPHVVRRTLKHLWRVGFFQGAKAVIFGDMSEGVADAGMQAGLQQACVNFATMATFPVFQTHAFGHGVNNMPLCLGVEYTLSVSADSCQLSCSK